MTFLTSSDPTTTPRPDPASRAPWDRWGWVMGAVWIVFLLFPTTAVLAAPVAVPVRVAALAALAAFATIYVAGFVRRRPVLGPWGGLALLTALGLALVPVIGVEAAGTAPFLVSFAVFTQPWPRAVVVAGVMVAVVVGVVLWQRNVMFVFIVLLVAGVTLLTRALDHHSHRHDELEREMAVVSERERVARDVHDVLGHSLTAISVKAELAGRLMEVDPERAARELAGVQALAREALAEVRTTVAGLRAARLGDELAAARTALDDAGIDADLPTDVDHVEVSHRIVLAWALREAVTNVVRHSGARRCTVALTTDRLTVTDDGATPCGPEGNGLRGLRERVAAAGGTVTFAATDPGHELVVQL